MLWLEQPSRGYAMPLEQLSGLYGLAKSRGLNVHMDGSRIFNAATALGVPASEIAKSTDSVMFCLSKGLSGPVASMLSGTREFIARAKGNRKVLGDELRQARYLAAAGLYGVEQMVDRLADDHENARRLANGIRKIEGLTVDRADVQMNIFWVEIGSGYNPLAFSEAMEQSSVRVNHPEAAGRIIRFVTHYGIESSDIDIALDVIRRVASEQRTTARETVAAV